MSIRNWYIGVLLFTLVSCDHFVLKKEHKNEIVNETLKKLNKTVVEQPPLFEVCKAKSEEVLEQCFQNTITTHIYDHLITHTIVVKEAIDDTIWVPLRITHKGEIILENFILPTKVEKQIPDLKKWLENSIHSLPKVKPAHTRGTPVTSVYKLPIVLHID
ncbi:hypothetical protein ABW636_04300 [Aquimarina sp. 2201CG1-2-11]|uniref:hypothetical protein n=1 Tax=Aquimarina discodermiae TaxID=3231043 RepID=UPI003463102B